MAKAKTKAEEVKEEKNTKTSGKKADQVVIDEIINTADHITTGTITAEQAGIDLASGEDQTVETYVRATPFGIEVWDPETKRTVFKTNG